MRTLICICVLLALLGSLSTPVSGQEWLIHRVSRGENLTIIARKYDVTVAELREWNELDSDRLQVDQKLRIPQRDQEWYVVRRGDNLSQIARRHDITLDLLRRLNGLSGDRIHPGQKLKLRPGPRDEAVHVVRRGDHLTGLARRYGLSVVELKRINDLHTDRIYVGQKLRVREAGRSTHIVERGDALWEIARAYGVSVDELKRINGLGSDRIYPGQELRLDGVVVRLGSYTVRRGDNLTEIARLHQMSLRELREMNRMRGSVIHPGQVLKVRPLLGGTDAGAVSGTPGVVDWESLRVTVPGQRRINAENGPYYYEQPRASRQKSRTYKEESSISPLVSYRHARTLWERFVQAVDKLPQQSNRLAGWHIVLDPGHGGIDPGTIVRALDAEGAAFYLVEDEYVYDLTLRVYVLLRQQGAQVTMTLLSPNHLLRGNEPATRTFVHDRNEVFNDETWNRRNRPETWPKGGQKYLDARVGVARRAYRNVDRNRTVFLSFHADNDPVAGDAVTLFYHQNSRTTDTVARDFARKLLPALGAGARIKGRSLGVLRKNPARYALLVEMRNLAYDEHIWAMRYEQLRQRDAEKVVEALLQGVDPR